MLFDVACAMREYFRATACPAKVYFGEVHLNTNLEELRVVWVPTDRDTFEAPLATQAQGRFSTPEAKAAAMYQGSNPRPIWMRWASAELHVWGFAPPHPMDSTRQEEVDYAVLDALVNHTVLALHKTCTGYWRPDPGGNVRSTLVVRRGFSYVLPVKVAIPIVEVYTFPCDKLGLGAYTWRGATLTSIQATVEMLNPPTGPTAMSSVTWSVGTGP